MPDVIELLNQDHRTVEQLFGEFESSRDHQTAMQICEELTLHATVEEEIVYPALAEVDASLEQEAANEHAEAEQLIEQIQGLEPDDPQLVELMTKLKESVQHHVEEEESEAWPKLRSEFGDKLGELGTTVEQRKQELMADLDGERGDGAGDAPAAGTGDLLDLSKEELLERAKQADISGRSNMTKDELVEALSQQG